MAEPDLEALLRRLTAQAAVLPLQGDDVEVLESPEAFFQELLAGLRTAQRRITIASLYFGTGGGREAEFADALAAAAHDASRPDLRMHILLDALRSTRPTPGAKDSSRSSGGPGIGGSPGSGGTKNRAPAMTSTAEMLATRLLEGQPGAGASAAAAGGGPGAPHARVAVSLFHTPALRGLLKRVLPPRVSEVIGVCHCKAYCFDDTVIISGANISSTYLSTRQDRYLAVRNTRQLADFLHGVVDAVGRFSYQLLPLPPGAAAADASEAGAAVGEGPAEDGAGGRPPRPRDLLLELLKQQQLPWQQLSWLGSAAGGDSAAAAATNSQQQLLWRPHHLQRHRQQRQQRYRLAPCPAGVDPVRQAYRFMYLFQHEMLSLFVPRQAWDSVLDMAALQAQHEAGAAAAAAAGGSRQQAGFGGLQHLGSHEGQHVGSADPLNVPSSSWATYPAGSKQPSEAAAVRESEAVPDTWIVPLVQAGFAGVRQEERCTLALLEWATTQHQQVQQQQQQVKEAHRQPQAGQDAGQAAAAGAGPSSRWRWGSSKGRHGAAAQGGGSPSVLLQLASPYLNLARPYEWFLSRQAAAADLELVTASPEANGFFGSKGVSGYIPLAYSLLEHRTWRRLTRHHRRMLLDGTSSSSSIGGWGGLASSEVLGGLGGWRSRQLSWRQRWAWGAAAGATAGADTPPEAAAAGEALGSNPLQEFSDAAAAASRAVLPGRRLYEYCRPGWEFHAKGIWVSHPAAERDQQERQRQPAPSPAWAPPLATAVGSSNFGFRSLHRDLEVQFLVVTRHPGLRGALGREVAALKRHCQQVAGDAHFQAPGRRGGPVARLAVRMLRGFL